MAKIVYKKKKKMVFTVHLDVRAFLADRILRGHRSHRLHRENPHLRSDSRCLVGMEAPPLQGYPYAHVALGRKGWRKRKRTREDGWVKEKHRMSGEKKGNKGQEKF